MIRIEASSSGFSGDSKLLDAKQRIAQLEHKLAHAYEALETKGVDTSALSQGECVYKAENAALKRYIDTHPSAKTSMVEFDEWYEIVKKNDALLTAD